MKKFYEKVKPFFLVILGALILLTYLPCIRGEGSVLALGIISIVVATFYVGYGIVVLLIGDKIPALVKKILDILVVGLFPAFVFTGILMDTIGLYENYTPTGWIIAILGMIAALGIVVVYAVAAFVKNNILSKLVSIFALTFVLALLMNVLFDAIGLPVVLGNITIVVLVIYAVYTAILFSAIGGLESGEQSKEPKEIDEQE